MAFHGGGWPHSQTQGLSTWGHSPHAFTQSYTQLSREEMKTSQVPGGLLTVSVYSVLFARCFGFSPGPLPLRA